MYPNPSGSVDAGIGCCMMNAKSIVSDLLAEAEIRINGDQPWDIQVHDEQFYQRIMEGADMEWVRVA